MPNSKDLDIVLINKNKILSNFFYSHTVKIIFIASLLLRDATEVDSSESFVTQNLQIEDSRKDERTGSPLHEFYETQR